MFVGGLTKKIREYLLTNFSFIKDKNILVLGSGNYGFESIFAKDNNVFSNDVNLYSLILANIFLDREQNFRIKKNIFDVEIDKVKYFFWLFNNLKYLNLRNKHYIDVFEKKIKNKKLFDLFSFEIEKIKIKDFFFCDAFDLLNFDYIYMTYPPTYAGGYEKMFSILDDFFEYEKVDYTLFDNEKIFFLYEKIKDKQHIFITDRALNFDYKIKVIGHDKKDVFIFTNLISNSKVYDLIFTIKNNKKRLNLDYVTKEDIDNLGDKQIEIFVVNNNVADYYKDVFLSKKIKKTMKATIVLCVTLGRKIVGFLGFFNSRMKDNTCLLVFDFVVLNYKKLSKLLIMLARSLEVKAFISEKLLTNLDTLLTAVFTDNPVSMKYRGEWELKERKSGKLIYKTGFYNTKDEEFKRWKEKYLK